MLGVIGSIVGGLFGQSSANKAAARERAWALEDQAEQFVRLRAAAEKGGFNPLAVLGASPNAGMVNPTQADRSNAFGQAIADAGLLYDQSRARTQELQAQKEANLLRMQNTRLQKMVVKQKLRPATPGVYEAKKDEASSAVAVTGSLGPFVGPGDPARALAVAGNPWSVDSGFSPTQKVEDEYGDFVSLPYGVGKMFNDFGLNIGARIGAARLKDTIGHAYAKKHGLPYTSEEKTMARMNLGKAWSEVARTSAMRRKKSRPVKREHDGFYGGNAAFLKLKGASGRF